MAEKQRDCGLSCTVASISCKYLCKIVFILFEVVYMMLNCWDISPCGDGFSVCAYMGEREREREKRDGIKIIYAY